jgi:tetratricopeptide (TPR) repeat protein
MDKIVKRLKMFNLMICFMLGLGGIVSAQQLVAVNNDEEKGQATFALTRFEAAMQKSNDAEKSFDLLTRTAPIAFDAGQTEKARSYAEALLKEAENMRTNWNYGNAIHAANLVLGRIALAENDLDEAKRFLLKAGKTPGSPQLKSFGPDMVLAKELLAKGEKAVVIEYFDLCANFWKSKKDVLENWKAAVQKDEIPDFDANLRYVFGMWRYIDWSKKEN